MANAGMEVSCLTQRIKSSPGKWSNAFVFDGNVGPTPM
jgi:hypothetical protein